MGQQTFYLRIKGVFLCFLLTITKASPSKKVFGSRNESFHNKGEANGELSKARADPQTSQLETTVTIIVIGRRQSGITSTTKELIGQTSCSSKNKNNASFSDITEYILSDIPVNQQNIYKLKLVDVPGLVDGRLLEEDAKILASLKSYLTTQENHGPTFFLILSRFDEKMDYKNEYLFIQLLKRVELFRDMFLDHIIRCKANGVILLTRLMSDLALNQRHPDTKISKFQQVLMDYTSANFSSLVSFVVGDNDAKNVYGVPVQDGFYLLPNEELYPKNVWQALLKSTNDTDVMKVFTSMIDKREAKMTCEANTIDTDWEYYDADTEAFKYLLKFEDTAFEETRINKDIDLAYGRKKNSRSKYLKGVVQKSALQLYLQREKIHEQGDLPRSHVKKLKFFQKSSLVSEAIPMEILSETFGLNMTIYTDSFTIGNGYLVLEDEVTIGSPFENNFSPSLVGYQLPNYMRCEILQPPKITYIANHSCNIPEYFSNRLGYLEFPRKANISLQKFSGKVKTGFNVPPEQGSSIAIITGLMEVRTILCTLRKSQFLRLNEPFLNEVNELKRFNSSDREAVAAWRNFFDRYGSHIISKGFGGGTLLGSIEGQDVLNAFNSSATIDNMLNSIMKFSSFGNSSPGIPKYKFFGGEMINESVSDNLYIMSRPLRYDVLKNWQNSLTSNFVMLNNELVLEPISSIIKEKIGQEKGEWVDEAIDLYIGGELNYKRSRINLKIRNATPFRTFHNTQNVSRLISLPLLNREPSEVERANLITQRNDDGDKNYPTLLNELREANRKNEELYQRLQREKENQKMEEERLRRNKCSWFGACAWEYAFG